MIDNEDWRVSIRQPLGMFGKNIFIYGKKLDGKVAIYNPSTQVVETADPSSNNDKYALYLTDEMIAQLYHELQKLNLPNVEQSFVEGKLASQTSHLNDLRKILKLDK